MNKELEVFTTRYSCRKFSNQTIKEEDLKAILEIARLSPSSLGLEPWKFYVIQDKKKLEEISLIANHQNHVKTAAALIIITSRFDFNEYFENKLKARNMPEEEIKKRINTYKPFLNSLDEKQKIAYSREQAYIALASILYAANALKINSCTIGGFNQEKLNSYLNLNSQKESATLIVALGISEEEKIPVKNRFSFDEVVKFL